eukprot:TRINITY_DN10543_c0_g1_i3.p1 TRINITY_DN10543_c0_g1~~TRINITY_DN10543_c0_g1_i3.p1  ORF type:complete len:168 (+),score=22.02 TRINITY_DN10543_c0_g1_i3:486-989(+)
MEAFATVPYLAAIDYDSHYTPPEDIIYKGLSYLFKASTLITYLRFDLRCTGINSQQLTALANGIANLNLLSELDLNISMNSHSLDAAVSHLIDMITPLQELTTLSLIFSACRGLTDVAGEKIVIYLRDNTSLNFVRLGLKGTSLTSKTLNSFLTIRSSGKIQRFETD